MIQTETPIIPRGTHQPLSGYSLVISSFLIMMTAWGVNYSYGILIKPLQAEFNWSRTVPSVAYSLVVFLRGVFHVVTGRLTDRFGPRVVVSACTVSLAAGYILMSRVQEIWHLYVFYSVFVAVGLSGQYVPLISSIARQYSHRRGLLTAIAMMGISAGSIIAPPVLERLIFTFGWRQALVITGIASFAIIITLAQFLRVRPTGDNGIAASPAAAAPLAPGLTFGESLRTRQFWLMVAMLICQFFCMQFVLIHLAPHVLDLGNSSIVAASVLTVVGLTSLGGRLAAGALADRVSNRHSIILSGIVMSAALLWAVLFRDLWTLYLFAVMFGLGYGGLYTLNSPLVAEVFGLRAHGQVFGASAFAGTFGGALGPAAAGFIFDATGSYRGAFATSAALCIASLALAWFLTPPKAVGGKG